MLHPKGIKNANPRLIICNKILLFGHFCAFHNFLFDLLHISIITIQNYKQVLSMRGTH